jgi:YgiT-type zinc finger domain-containing protein
MKCTVCGARMHAISTDLPLKLSEERIVILKQLPVLQCEACREYLIEDTVMARIVFPSYPRGLNSPPLADRLRARLTGSLAV